MVQQVPSNPPAGRLGLVARKYSDPKPQVPVKRKRESTAHGKEELGSTFAIRSLSKTSSERVHKFKPIRIISRTQLSLAFLDTSTPAELGGTQLFTAHIDVLERPEESTAEQRNVPKVLIARHEDTQSLYAVERVRCRAYALCKLQDWLKEEDAARSWGLGQSQNCELLPCPSSDGTKGSEWWRLAVVDPKQAQRQLKHVKLSMSKPVSETKPPDAGTGVQTKPIAAAEEQQVNQHPDQQVSQHPDQQVSQQSDHHIASDGVLPAAPSAQEQLEALVEHYLTAVYMSKMSLAYFVKGPLTRIRNAFTSPESDAPPTHELISFLKSMLLSRKAEEKKYQEKLPQLIKAILPSYGSDSDHANLGAKSKKSKKKKLKPSREGIYPQEADVVKSWWLAETPHADVHGEETMDQRIRRSLADLRVREALAQMMLMLEIIALEALCTSKKSQDNKEITTEGHASEDAPLPTKPRKKKDEDMGLVLELLLDRLCIWQSVELDGVLDFHTNTQDDGKTGESEQKSGNDRLQSFCVEVIVPFYMNRLPEQARLVNKKLGGPSAPSVPKRRAMKPPTTSRKSGEPKEPEAKKSRRSLARVATDTTAQTSQHRRPPSLVRSATDSALINGTKREASEVLLHHIPFQRSPSQAARQALSHFKHLKGREIDLVSTNAAAAAKLKHKRRVEEDLRDAISALKKPNRGLTAGAYADELESREHGASNRSRKAANPTRRSLQDVQVTATPRTVRKGFQGVGQTPVHHRDPFNRPRLPASSITRDFAVPSSSMVPATTERQTSGRTSSLQARYAGVAETPSKRPASKAVDFGTAASGTSHVLQTPSRRHSSSTAGQFASTRPAMVIEATPSKSSATPSSLEVEPGNTTSRSLFVTPVKPRTTARATPDIRVVSTPAAAATVAATGSVPTTNGSHDENENGEQQGASIFDALGWNDDDDLM